MEAVVRKKDGMWIVALGDEVLSEHETQAQAYRAADKVNGEPNTKREATTDWLWNERIKGGL